jgi:hypothetical protein
MYSKIKISKGHLVILKMPLTTEKIIDLKNIKSVEIYGKNVIPPLVLSIFLLSAQLILFSSGKMFIKIQGIPIIVLINIPIIICLIVAIIRSKYSTMKITSYEHNKSLVLHFIPRSKGELIAKQIYEIMNK